MVNTRKKATLQAEDQSSTPTTNSPSTARSTRRSLGAIPTQVLTPTRRSRRLSNSSVESLSTDLPPTRRSTRGKTTPVPDSEIEDVELVTIKKRKLTEKVEDLGSIAEEKNDSTSNHTEVTTLNDIPEESKDLKEVEKSDIKNPPIIDLEKEVQLNEGTVPKTKEPVVEKNTEIVDLISDTEVSSCVVDSAVIVEKIYTNFVPVIAEEIIENTVLETESTLQDETVATTTDNKIVESTTENKTAESTTKDETSASQVIKEDPVPSQVASTNSKVQEILNRINTFNSLPAKGEKKNNGTSQLNLLKKKKKKAAKKNIATQEKPSEEPKVPLPCGAEVMKTIPRGKSKSGREWKDPKSNPRYLYKDQGLKMPLSKIQQLRDERRQVLELENRMKEEERTRRVDLAKRRELNKKRTEENARKNEIVQVIRNTNKIKRMNKKQLKLIQKRDTSE